jgi:hypothetical protein
MVKIPNRSCSLRCPSEDPFALVLEHPLDFLSITAYPIARFVNFGDGQYNMTSAERQVHDGLPISPDDSSGVLVVIAQEPAKSLATPHAPLPTYLRDPREQQHVGLPLMIPFSVVVRNIFVERPTQRTLTKENDLRQTLLSCRSYPSLRVGIQIWTSSR